MTERTNAELLEEIENGETEPIHTITDPTLIAVYKALIEMKTAETRLDEAVAAARQAGQSWQAIGDTVGLTRQGALKRYRNTAAVIMGAIGN